MIDTKDTKIKKKKGRITLKMEKTLAAIPESKTMAEAMRKGNYSVGMQDNPKQLTEREGWHELLARDLPDELITTSLAEDIIGKPHRRVEELKLAAKLKGKLNEGNNVVIIQSEPIKEVVMIVPQGREGEVKI